MVPVEFLTERGCRRIGYSLPESAFAFRQPGKKSKALKEGVWEPQEVQDHSGQGRKLVGILDGNLPMNY